MLGDLWMLRVHSAAVQELLLVIMCVLTADRWLNLRGLHDSVKCAEMNLDINSGALCESLTLLIHSLRVQTL